MIQRNRLLPLPRARFIQGPVGSRPLLAGLLLGGLTIWACGVFTGLGPVASVEVTPASVTLDSLGETVQLAASAQDASGKAIAGKSFTWSSADEFTAIVTDSGLATAVANGSATIMATTDGVSGTAAIQVDDPWQDSAAAFLAALTEATDIVSSADTAILESPAIQSVAVLGGMFNLGGPLDQVLGTTFVYNALAARYQPDLSRTDAPADGARFLLYAVADQEVIIPLDEIGYVDLVQTAPPSDTTVSVRAVVRGQTAFSYEATGFVELDSTRVTAMGTIVTATSDIIFDATEQIKEDPIFYLRHSHNQRLETEKGEFRREVHYFLAKQFSDSDTDMTRRIAWVASSVGGPANQTGQQDSTVIESRSLCVYPIIFSFNGEEAAVFGFSSSIYGRDVVGDLRSKLGSFKRFFSDACGSFRGNRVSDPLLLPAWAAFAEVL